MMSRVSAYDDAIWEQVPEDAGPLPGHLVEFVRSLGPADHALDLGCGDGRLTAELRAERVTAADVSAVALERARGRLQEAALVPLRPNEPLPMEDRAFDLVLCAETLEHVQDVGLLVSEARRVLRPGGTLAVTTPAHRGIVLGGFERRFDPLSPHIRFFTKRSLTELLEGAGFEPESIRRRRGTLLAIAR
jgi:ubiquinone/menaquinone biosynthesis C-methylase UbiE